MPTIPVIHLQPGGANPPSNTQKTNILAVLGAASTEALGALAVRATALEEAVAALPTVQNNLTGSAPPTATDNVAAGYTVGKSIWIDIVAVPKEAYRLLGEDAGVAEWEKTTVDGAEVSALIASHAAATDPHGDRAHSVQRANHAGTQELATISDAGTAASADTGTAEGEVPLLGAGGKLPSGVLPPLSLTATIPVTDQAERLLLTTEQAAGKLVVEGDTGKSFGLVLDGDPSDNGDWVQVGDRDITIADVAGLQGVLDVKPTSLPAVTGYTGGGATNLDGQNLAGIAAGRQFTFIPTSAPTTLETYVVKVSGDATSSPDVIRAADWATSGKVYRRLAPTAFDLFVPVPVADEVAMLAIVGGIPWVTKATRADNGLTYLLIDADTTNVANWQPDIPVPAWFDTLGVGYNANAAFSMDATGGFDQSVSVGSYANGYNYGAAMGYGANGYNYGAAMGYDANGYDYGAAMGYYADGSNSGAAMGYGANGYDYGAAMGYYANGYDYGAAMGYYADGSISGAAMGYYANGYNYGAAMGYGADGSNSGAAMGYGANGYDYGAAMGYYANGYDYGAAMGYGANGHGLGNFAVGGDGSGLLPAVVPDTWEDTVELGRGTATLEGGLNFRGFGIVNYNAGNPKIVIGLRDTQAAPAVTDPGNAGDMVFTDAHTYRCFATADWRRVATAYATY